MKDNTASIAPLALSGPVRVAVVAAQWHDDIILDLIAGAKRAYEEAGGGLAAGSGGGLDVYRVPGSFELPLAAQQAARIYDAVVALGVIIRGQTPHFDYVCHAATEGLMRVALDEEVPVGFGVLTCDTVAQAVDRCGRAGSSEDKGYEAMVAVLNTLGVISGM